MTITKSRVAASVLSAVLLAGCSAPGPQYYSLAEAAGPTHAAAAAPGFIEFAAISMPERFARPQLVVRPKDGSSGPQVDILEQHRWSSSFENELRDALASGVASRVGAVDVSKSGRQRGEPVTRIAVQMGQFDAVVGSRVDAAFSWTLKRTDEGPATGCQLSLSEPVGSGMDALAQGAQRVTAKLADAIAASVTGLQAGRMPPCGA
jgi:hypothetical protein